MNIIRRPLRPFMGRLAGLTVVTVAFFATGAVPVSAAYADSKTVSVLGHGEASAVPDMAVLSAGVEVTKPTAKEALDSQGAIAKAVLDAVRARGLTDKDIRTEAMSLNPVYTYNDAGAQLAGYQASQAFSLKIHKLDKADEVVEAVVNASGNAGRINGIAFEAENTKALREEARMQAFWDAHDKAEQYADLSGLRLGRALSIDETSDNHFYKGGGETGAPARTAGAPIAPGEIHGKVDTTVVFEIK
ncbi:SIMPL domain-containing protein [Streptomyces sp. NPDC127051]|uniref:SIMPL domain-containing protein n=1 Tax=Streptomyces sp. NPDC127051 TaxID=3347119 RepID=UPI0036679241